MSNGTMGAATAAPAVRPEDTTPALADQWESGVLIAIEEIQDPADAEALLARVTACAEAIRLARLGQDRERRWKGLRLKAEARYGELLPEKQPGKRNLSQPAKGDKDAQSRARKVNAAKQADPDAFEDYINNDPKPTREGLLRKTGTTSKPETKSATNVFEDDAVLAWVSKRMTAGKGSREIMAESKAGQYGWPAEGRYLGQNAAEKAMAIIRDRARRPEPAARRKPKESGKRLRQLHAEKREGRDTSDLWHLQVAVAKAVAVLEGFDLPELDWTEDNEALVFEIHEDLERHAQWNDAALDAVVAHMSDLGRQRKIRALRDRAEHPSSTPGERATAARLADKLERKRDAAQLGN